MGYYTEYSLELDNSTEEEREAIAQAVSQDENMLYALGEHLAGAEPSKWYRHEEDIKALSAQFPTVTFVLYGVGEEHPDMWRKFFINGKLLKHEIGEITYG